MVVAAADIFNGVGGEARDAGQSRAAGLADALGDHRAEEIDQGQMRPRPGDAQAEEHGAGGIEAERHEGLADLAANAGAGAEQPGLDQAAADHRSGLRGEPGKLGNLRLGELAVGADQRQHQTLVEGAERHVIGAAAGRRAFGVLTAENGGAWNMSCQMPASSGHRRRSPTI